MVFKIEKNKNYTVMSNYHLRDKNLSLKAKGLLSFMLSLPETWDYSINGLVAICKEEETAIKTALKELQKNKYLKINKFYPNETKSGKIEYEYVIYEEPYLEEKEKEQEGENLPLEILSVENKGQINKKETNTEEQIDKLDISIKHWYMDKFPNDDVGKTLSSTVSFLDLNNLLNSGYGDVYTLLGGDADTVIRERCFEKLCELVDCNYDDIYNKWINLKNDYRNEIELDEIEKE